MYWDAIKDRIQDSIGVGPKGKDGIERSPSIVKMLRRL
jgi:hypothetical protein